MLREVEDIGNMMMDEFQRLRWKDSIEHNVHKQPFGCSFANDLFFFFFFGLKGSFWPPTKNASIIYTFCKTIMSSWRAMSGG